MPWDSLFRILERLPPTAAAALAILAVLVVGVIMVLGFALNFGFNIYKFTRAQAASERAHDERNEIARAASCNVPPHIVQALDGAIELQKVDVQARESEGRQLISVMSELKNEVKDLAKAFIAGKQELAVWMARQRRD